ncbi:MULTISPECIES: ABC transporter permease [unclassified Pseudomonas]|uniref:ABC transporter permease n=1 Tax=unclassified Pseudomonas TaxID=196821 RepID=UPI000BD7C81C|nr:MULTISPECIES: ABC transporter permease [unclassified Pseudomonas]PVZ20407.1 putative ABC transport system permease protein [Pseudomonas sp. URIL14HWK12:I12]PVZ27473.1 putative ABC transport system permease protein [Pseudomonas sp. URIL14HWK12:I10]PVZ38362.1 putative ABC transport system permease protein [Pseudomonas sp. URIL14HWK12:I11]SNZ03659.1 putative ABC transport system permease protein [Pseudomonas sp. URIL14HWK12:I9]
MVEHVLDCPNPAWAPQGYGPSWLQQIREPVANLRQLGRRAALALLGIAVGCMAVVALLTIGHNAQQQAMSVFQGMGSDLLVANLQPPDDGRNTAGSAITALQADALRAAIPGIAAAAPLIIASADARLKGHALSTTLLGSNAELHRVLDLQLAEGRSLSRFDARNTHAVLGANVAAAWERLGLAAKPGDRVQIGGYLFQVIGTLRPAGQNPLLPVPMDDAILLSIGSMRRIIPAPQITSVLARSPNSASLARLAPALQQWLATQVPGYGVDVQIPRQLLEGMAKQSRLFSWLLAGLGSIALLVGGIGVMNVMVMNVAERRREIGVRMALGARPKDIALLFLLEAVVLAASGACLGTVAGLIAAWVFVHFSGGLPFAWSPTAVPLGVGSALAAGLFFGLSPAMAAARLAPVQALRDA